MQILKLPNISLPLKRRDGSVGRKKYVLRHWNFVNFEKKKNYYLNVILCKKLDSVLWYFFFFTKSLITQWLIDEVWHSFTTILTGHVGSYHKFHERTARGCRERIKRMFEPIHFEHTLESEIKFGNEVALFGLSLSRRAELMDKSASK